MEEYDGIILFKHDSIWAQRKAIKYLNKRLTRNNTINIESIEKIYVPMEECIAEGETQAFIHEKKLRAFVLGGTGTRYFTFLGDNYYKGTCNSKIKIIVPKYNMFNDKVLKLIMNKKFEKVSAFENDKVDTPILKLDLDSKDDYYYFQDKELDDKETKLIVKHNEILNSYVRSEGLSSKSINYIERAFMEVAAEHTVNLLHCSAVTDFTINSKKITLIPLWVIKISIKNQESIVIINDSNEKITSELFYQKEVEKLKAKKSALNDLVAGTILIGFILLFFMICRLYLDSKFALYLIGLGIVTCLSLVKAESFLDKLTRKKEIYKVLKRKFKVEEKLYDEQSFLNNAAQ